MKSTDIKKIKKITAAFTAVFMIALFVGLVIALGYADWVIFYSQYQHDGISPSGDEGTTPVCYNSDTSTYYYTVERALNDAASGQTVVIIPGTNPTINNYNGNSPEVKSGVTLNIPPTTSAYKYTAELSLTAKSTTDSDGGTCTFTVQKSENGGDYYDYIVWTGTYKFLTKSVTVTCSRTGHSNTSKPTMQYIQFTFTSQTANVDGKAYTSSINKTYSATPNASGKCGKIFSCGGTWSYSDYTNTVNISVNTVKIDGVIYLIGYTPKFEWSNNSAQISNTNCNGFSSDTTLSIDDYSDVSNYSMTALFTSTVNYTDNSSVVTIAEGVELVNNGTIYVGGSLAAGTASINGYSGNTFGQYSTVKLEKGAKITSSGTVYCYGYINEAAEDNGSSFNVKNGGTVYAPFVVRDFRGGAITVSCYNSREEKGCFPFNQYEVRNISCLANYYYGATLTGMANLYANDTANATQMNMISNDSDAFIQLTDSAYSYVSAKFTEKTTGEGVCDLKIYGGCTLNAMSLTLSVSGVSKTVNSTDFYFPISRRFKISLLKSDGQDSASFNVSTQKLQFLPGSSLTIGAGTTVTASTLVFYKEWPSSYYDKYYYKSGSTYVTKDSAYMTVNGALTADMVTGLVKSDAAGAKITISGVSSTNYQVIKSTASGTLDNAKIILGTDMNEYFNLTNTATFYTYDSSTGFNTSTLNESVTAGTYTSVTDSNGVSGFHT